MSAIVCKPALVVPDHQLTEEQVISLADVVLGGDPRLAARMKKVIAGAGVKSRYMVQPLEQTMTPAGFGTRNDLFIHESKRLGERAAQAAMDNAGVTPKDIDLIITTSCTGIMIPSLCAHLIPTMGFARNTRRLPITERGCAAGAFAMALARDHIAMRGGNVLIVAHELCSLTYQRQDLNMQALIGALLFGDGVAACVVRGDGKYDGAGFELGESSTWLFEDSWKYMGFSVQDDGMHLVLDKEVPGAVERAIAPVMLGFLEQQGMRSSDVDFHVLHPGGRKIIEEVARTFGQETKTFQASYDCLAEVGNLSSASVLVVLKSVFERYRPAHQARGLLAAFGPGFSCELSVGRWLEGGAHT
jgi:1,3,6,8-tetrahydroxynaphthalene synthase